MTKIITHRGLDADRANPLTESSFEAFIDLLSRGYGLEFDIQFTSDRQPVVLHDKSIARWTKGVDSRLISEITLVDLLLIKSNRHSITTLSNLLSWIKKIGNLEAIHAVHLKHIVQDEESLKLILDALKEVDPKRFVLFDTKIATATYIKSCAPEFKIAPSVAHPYDIERYNTVVGGTLLSVEEVLKHRNLFDWVWLDEWDRVGPDGQEKKFYTKETFEVFRNAGLKISLVTPELHATSPGLLGGEAHGDAKDHVSLVKRIEEIVTLKPDGICTDWPDLAQSMINTQK